jgi:hypothetical protein
LSALLDLPLVRAAEQVVPIAATGGEGVQRLRTWATGRCLDAARGGIYMASAASGANDGGGSVAIRQGRRIDRGANGN